MRIIAILSLVVAGLIFAAPDSHAAGKRMHVGKKERLHELCDVSVCHADLQTTESTSALHAVDGRGSFFWLLALLATGAFLLKEPFAGISNAMASVHRQRCGC